MATVNFFLDRRYKSADGLLGLKLRICHRGGNTAIHLVSLRPEQWDAAKERIKKHPDQLRLNAYITKARQDVSLYIISLADDGRLGRMSAKDIRDGFAGAKDEETGGTTFIKRFERFVASKARGTKTVYNCTLSLLRKFRKDIEQVTFDEITPAWLTEFDAFMAERGCACNYRAINFRNIRAVFNSAIDEGETNNYPFRRFKIKTEATEKRSLSIVDLRYLITCPVDDYQEIYRDMFILIFCLVGINAVDLYNLKGITRDGRVEYRRAKTGTLYSIKVEPEAQAIIEKYKGVKGLLSIADRWDDHRNFLHQCNKALRHIGYHRQPGRGGKKSMGLFPELTTYWARHTWATIAAELDIPTDIIGQALGHSTGKQVTEIYIKRNRKKVDEANRKVLDYVFNGLR